MRHRLTSLLFASVASFAVLACAPVSGGKSSPGGQGSIWAGDSARSVTVAVTRDGDRWTADYTLNRDAAVWMFPRSALTSDSRQPWRPGTWTVETPGVVLERAGFYDIVRATDGGAVPRELRIRFQPRAGSLEADYDPALIFSDGAVALYSEQFDLLPLASVEAARALPDDLNGVALEGGSSEVRWQDKGRTVLYEGRRTELATSRNANTYVLFGEARIREGEGVTTVIDTGLPDWLTQELSGFTPQILDYYARQMWSPPGPKPSLMASWTGPTRSKSSMGGSVSGDLISMNFEGERMLEPDEDVLARTRWFIAHEAAHFWLGDRGLRYAVMRDSWITEGGADLLAIRGLKALDPAYDDKSELQREVDDCIRLAVKPVATAAERGEHRAYYACGAVWSMVLEASARSRGGDYFTVLKALRRQNPDGVLTREEWLAELTRQSRDPSLAGDINGLLDRGSADPAAVIARLFDRSGIPARRNGQGLVLS